MTASAPISTTATTLNRRPFSMSRCRRRRAGAGRRRRPGRPVPVRGAAGAGSGAPREGTTAWWRWLVGGHGHGHPGHAPLALPARRAPGRRRLPPPDRPPPRPARQESPGSAGPALRLEISHRSRRSRRVLARDQAARRLARRTAHRLLGTSDASAYGRRRRIVSSEKGVFSPRWTEITSPRAPA
jgi:hypothetical protein